MLRPVSESQQPKRPRRNVYLESRYRKLARGLPQTIFWCPTCKGDRRRKKACTACGGSGKLARESVQELIGRRALPAFAARTGLFHGAGREDVDVLMLGRGRPFVYEVVGASRTDVDLEQLRAEILEKAAGAVELEPFRVVARERVAFWKQAQVDKIYRAEVRTTGVPADLGPARAFAGVVVQRTPQRVAHRRADLDRERHVRVLSLQPLEPERLELRMQCQHGTYVKEWISGDEGRTTPSLSSLLGVPCTCEVLDVEELLTDELPGAVLPPPAPAFGV